MVGVNQEGATIVEAQGRKFQERSYQPFQMLPRNGQVIGVLSSVINDLDKSHFGGWDSRGLERE